MLSAALLVGIVVSFLDRKDSDSIPDFDVQKGAIPVPEMPKETTNHQTVSPVAINQATAKDFQKLPGIGPQIAQRIVAHRDQHGSFKKIEDLTNVSGIGPKTLERIRPQLILNQP